MHKIYLAAGSCYLVDDVGKHNILVVSIATDLFPLRILAQPDVVAKEGMADASEVSGVSNSQLYIKNTH